MYELHDYRFGMMMGGGRDIWGLTGKVYGHPHVKPGSFRMVSTPTAFDEANEIVTTTSGSVYKLINPAGDKKKIFDEISEVMIRGSYEVR